MKIVLLFLFLNYLKVYGRFFEKHPDFLLNRDEKIIKYGYDIEYHKLITEDGYILTLYRIYRREFEYIKNKKSILMMHGLAANGDLFLNGGKNSIPFNFIDYGYDVWLGNARGTQMSMEHVNLTAKDAKFWNFSWHEIGYYDLPAMIDYILGLRRKKKLFYLGHSQGGTTFYVLTSLRPEYQQKIAQASLLAPSAFLRHFKYFSTFTLKITEILVTFLAESNIFIFPPFNGLEFLSETCSSITFQEVCQQIFQIFGFTKESSSNAFASSLRGATPVSIFQLSHYLQIIQSGHFRQYNYGEKNNLKAYGSVLPPDYPLDKIKLPVAIYFGRNDLIVPHQDISYTCSLIPGCTQLFEMGNPKWSHNDFLFADDNREALIIPLIENIYYINDF